MEHQVKKEGEKKAMLCIGLEKSDFSVKDRKEQKLFYTKKIKLSIKHTR